MPKSLPPAPSLEYLKKRAKALLRDGSAAKLADAQHAVAREYGFRNWPALKKHIGADDPLSQLKQAFEADDPGRVAAILESNPELRSRINDPNLAFDSPMILVAAQQGRRKMIDVLLQFGADINARSQWWAGGFGVLDWADADLARFLIERGAIVDAHAAAHLGMLERLQALVGAHPGVHARGGDGKMPLHCASTIEIAQFLLDHGADIDARDIDHESTAAQYLVRERQEVVRYLVSRRCKTDILMATAIGDIDLIRKLLRDDPECIRMRVSEEYFLMVQPQGGGTIYQWQFGWYVSAHQVARQLGREAISRLLMDHTPADEKLLVGCWLHDRALVKKHADAVLTPAARRHLAHAARNNDTQAVRLMLSVGLPVNSRGQNGGTPLHWAAFHGNAEMVEAILSHDPPLDIKCDAFKATPLQWAIRGSKHGWNRRKGDYPATVKILLNAGAKPPREIGGTPEVKQVLRQFTPAAISRRTVKRRLPGKSARSPAKDRRRRS